VTKGKNCYVNPVCSFVGWWWRSIKYHL